MTVIELSRQEILLLVKMKCLQMLTVLAALVALSLAAPSRHNPDPGFGGPTGSNLGGIQIVDPNNPDPGFGGPSGGNLGGIHVVDQNNPDPGFNGPSGR